jgi:hypothetical protein
MIAYCLGADAYGIVWEPEWTEAVIKASYDSIFTSGFDGSRRIYVK